MPPISPTARRGPAKGEPSTAYQARRDMIVEAAVGVFNRLGLEGASMSAFAAELNIDRASLYYYISSKDELFDELVRSVVERNLEYTRKIQASNLSARRKLRDLIAVLMTSYSEHYPLFYIYIRENLSRVGDSRYEWSTTMRKMNAETVDTVIAIIEQGYADGSFRNIGSSRVAAYGLLGIIGWTHRWYRPGTSDATAEEIGKIYAELLFSGLESPYQEVSLT